jgi:hypothetical protein
VQTTRKRYRGYAGSLQAKPRIPPDYKASNKQSLIQEFRRQLLLVAGFSQEEVGQIDIAGLSDEEFQELVSRRFLENRSGDCGVQKVVGLNELEKYLESGWEYVATLPNQKVVVRQVLA